MAEMDLSREGARMGSVVSKNRRLVIIDECRVLVPLATIADEDEGIGEMALDRLSWPCCAKRPYRSLGFGDPEEKNFGYCLSKHEEQDLTS